MSPWLPIRGLGTFQGLYCGRKVKADDEVPGPEEGCALLLRSSRLELLHSTTVRSDSGSEGSMSTFDVLGLKIVGIRGSCFRRLELSDPRTLLPV